MPLGVTIHYARYTDEDDKDVTLTVEGKPCKTCGSTRRYKVNRNCVDCKLKGGKHEYKPGVKNVKPK